MGQEAAALVSFGEVRSQGRALLETSELIFRGDFRLVIPFKDIRDLEAADGVLAVRFSGGEARFELGVLAPKWAEKIRNPRGRLAKLGLKPGACVMVVGLLDSDFQDDLAEMEAVVVDAAAGASARPYLFRRELPGRPRLFAGNEQADQGERGGLGCRAERQGLSTKGHRDHDSCPLGRPRGHQSSLVLRQPHGFEACDPGREAGEGQRRECEEVGGRKIPLLPAPFYLWSEPLAVQLHAIEPAVANDYVVEHFDLK